MSPKTLKSGCLKEKSEIILQWGSFLLVTITLLFSITEHYGLWDGVRCTNQLREVAQNMNTSYANVQRIFAPHDTEWKCLIKLIEEYSVVELPDDKPLMLVFRFQALDSVKQEYGENKMYEWTAPTTPLAVGFVEATKEKLESEDIMIIGTIGDLLNWVERDKNNFSFRIQNTFLGLLSLSVAFLLLIIKSPLKQQEFE